MINLLSEEDQLYVWKSLEKPCDDVIIYLVSAKYTNIRFVENEHISDNLAKRLVKTNSETIFELLKKGFDSEDLIKEAIYSYPELGTHFSHILEKDQDLQNFVFDRMMMD